MFNLTRYIAFFMLLAVSFFASAAEYVIVIDAGHGGHDAGCVGRKAREKDIVLDVAKKLGEKLRSEMSDVKVVLTRSDDRFIPLQERANIANRAGGDLFISLHVNSVAKESPGRASVSGAQVYTLGPDKSKNNLNVAMRENSVIELESDYTKKYKGFDPSSTESYIIFELNQNAHMKQSIDFATLAQRHLVKDAGRLDKGVRQDGFWVLWATRMPSVLVELDFICNPTQETFLSSADGKRKCVNALFNAIKEYRSKSGSASSKTENTGHASLEAEQKDISNSVASAFGSKDKGNQGK